MGVPGSPMSTYGVPCTPASAQFAFWLSAPTLPYAQEEDAEFEFGSEEVMRTLEADRWLFPPTRASASAGSHGQGMPVQFSSGDQSISSSTLGGLPPAQPAPDYDFKFLRTPASRHIVSILLQAAFANQDSRARRMGQALENFVKQAYAFVQTPQGTVAGRYMTPDDESKKLLEEAQEAMRFLVRKHRLNVSQDLVFALEAFGVSKGRPQPEFAYLSTCLRYVLEAALKAADDADMKSWCKEVADRMRSESGELYSNVDVRSWPIILQLAKLDTTMLAGPPFAEQVQYQLCTAPELPEWSAGLSQAAMLIRDLRQAHHFEADKIREIFNNKIYFSTRQRHKFLVDVLKNASCEQVEQVLQGIDENDVDNAEMFCPEMNLLNDLIRDLHADIHSCKNAYFNLVREWLRGRYNGVTNGQELTPEQICDHIEPDANHAELLKVAVQSLLKQNRKFEAARMLARPNSIESRVFETNKNDKQLSYLVTLFMDLEQPSDEFGPIEEDQLALGCDLERILYVDNLGEYLNTLENDLLSSSTAGAIGIWWTWRCLDPKLQSRPRAEILAIAYNQRLAIVDFNQLEQAGEVAEARGKDVVRRILAAEHLLKVTHDLDRPTLGALQRALTMQHGPRSHNNDQLTLPGVSPVVDLTMAVAFTRRVFPGSPAVTVLSKLTFEYLRLELCMAEALSNFERRPLRESQLHYALTLAWCPLTILRVLCANGILAPEHLMHMSLRLGFSGNETCWDEARRTVQLSNEVARVMTDADNFWDDPEWPYAENLWDVPEWVEQVPRPDYEFDLPRAIREKLHLGTIVAPVSDSLMAACRTLSNRQTANDELRSLYREHAERRQVRKEELERMS